MFDKLFKKLTFDDIKNRDYIFLYAGDVPRRKEYDIEGIVGLAMSCTTYPIYKKILNSRKKKYAHQIMELSDRITKG